MSYSVHAYGRMILDRVRVNAYSEALRKLVKPGSVVLDIGTGTGTWAILAMKYGARKVYAVDPNPAIEVGRRLARENGFGGEIEFIHARSDQIDLPERVDGVVSDLRGRSPLSSGHIQAIADARFRHLKPGGWLIPRTDKIYASLLSSPELYRSVSSPWYQNEMGLSFRAGARWVMNQEATYQRFEGEHRSTAKLLGVVDYRTAEDPSFKSRVEWKAESTYTAHGMAVWFDADLTENVGFTTSPWAEERSWIYGVAFLPFEIPLEIRKGEPVMMGYRALWQDGYERVWECQAANSQARQSTFLGRLWPNGLPKDIQGERGYRLNRTGEMQRFLLAEFHQKTDFTMIAERLVEKFPQHCSELKGALEIVRTAARRFCQPDL